MNGELNMSTKSNDVILTKDQLSILLHMVKIDLGHTRHDAALYKDESTLAYVLQLEELKSILTQMLEKT